jgi:hypothetical protein
MNEKREYHILNLGAGVQSTTLYLMFQRSEIKPQIDYAIFADTQDEPRQVYEHMAWLQSLDGPPILVRSAGRLGDDLVKGVNSTGQSFAAIPAFTTSDEGVTHGRTRRQCSKEYKVDVIQRAIRREILGLQPGARIPKSVTVHEYFGISLDEARRAAAIRERKKGTRYVPHFPLVDHFWTRPDCLTYLADKVPHVTPRSACVECPFRSDVEWQWLKTNDPEGFDRAVEIDHALRAAGTVANRQMDQVMYLHRSCQPLELVQLDLRPRMRDLQLSMSFAEECMGVCGV